MSTSLWTLSTQNHAGGQKSYLVANEDTESEKCTGQPYTYMYVKMIDCTMSLQRGSKVRFCYGVTRKTILSISGLRLIGRQRLAKDQLL